MDSLGFDIYNILKTAAIRSGWGEGGSWGCLSSRCLSGFSWSMRGKG